MESDDVVRYGICKQNTLVSLMQQNSDTGPETLLLGSLILIVQQIDHKFIAIQVCDWKLRATKWKNTVWFCPIDNIIPVDSELWEYMLGIGSPMERIKLIKNNQLCNYLKQLCLGHITLFKYNNMKMKGLVRYIGPVKNMGAGSYIGIELLDEYKHYGTCNGSLSSNTYFKCSDNDGIFITAADIIASDQLISHSDESNQELNDLVDISTQRQRHNKLKLDTANLRFGFHHRNDQLDDDGVKLLADWPQTVLSETTPSQIVNKLNECLTSTDLYPTSQEQSVTDEVDLIEILRGEWPAEAGDTIASSLNCNNTTATVRMHEFERNKSLNPVSHLVHSKKRLVGNKYERFGTKTIHNSLHSNKIINTDPPVNTTKISGNNNTHIYDTPERSTSPPSINNDLEHLGLGIGSLVEVTTDVSDPIYGVIRWISPYKPHMVGIELEEEQTHLPIDLTDGTFNGQRYFQCAPGKGLFVPVEQCHVDQRFQETSTKQQQQQQQPAVIDDVVNKAMFGQVDCPVIEGAVPPLCTQTVEEMCGKFRGIQGHHNSCYLDATLFAMFACTSVFDSLLFRPQSANDIERYVDVQRVLREEIVNPLRKNLYVRADRVMKLRTLLEELSSVTGLTSEEKDPEEFLNSLLAQILRAESFLKLSSGQEAFYYQLFVEKNERLTLPSVQQLFEQSFIASNIKLKEVPSCLIIQMPRFGKSYKMYPRIIPSQVLDVTDVIENSPRQCTVCGKLAEYECLQCFDPCGEGLEGTAFCSQCCDLKHSVSSGRATTHRPTSIQVPIDFREMAEHCPTPPRLYMELFAVVCIETSHYVAFVKCGSGQDAPWCFFDSMADRKGEKNGYNIPEITACPGLASWLGEDASALPSRSPQLPEPARRLLCDAYLCLYQSSDIMMYR